MHKARKENYQKDKKIQQSFDHCVLKSRKLAQHTKKVDCPVMLSAKIILTFPLCKIEKDTKRRRAEAAKTKNQIISRRNEAARKSSKI